MQLRIPVGHQSRVGRLSSAHRVHDLHCQAAANGMICAKYWGTLRPRVRITTVGFEASLRYCFTET